MGGSTVPVCSNTTNEFEIKAESGNDFDITSEYFELCIISEIFSIEKYPQPSLSNKITRLGRFNPYPRFFGTITERHFWKKSIIITGDVTDETNKIKIICADRVSVGLSYDVNFKWHMPI